MSSALDARQAVAGWLIDKFAVYGGAEHYADEILALPQIAGVVEKARKVVSSYDTRGNLPVCITDLEVALAAFDTSRPDDAETTGFAEALDEPRPAQATGEWSDVWKRQDRPDSNMVDARDKIDVDDWIEAATQALTEGQKP